MTLNIVSCVMNILIASAVGYGLYLMTTGKGAKHELSTTGIRVLKYFTVDSNILMGLAAIIYAVADIRVLSGAMARMPQWLYILKHCATVSVTVTLLVTVCFLAPGCKRGYWEMFRGGNLYFHALVPVAAILTLVFTESENRSGAECLLICLIPTVLYAIFYAVNVFSHAADGRVEKKYDWYGFMSGGIKKWPIPVIAMLMLTLAAGFLLWKL